MRCHGTNAPMHGMHSRHAKHRSPVLQTRPRSRLAAVKASAGGSSDAFDEPISKEALGVVFSQPTIDTSEKVQFPLTVPLLPFSVEEVFLPGSVKTLHLYEPRYIALLDEVLCRPGSNRLMGHVVVEQLGDAVGSRASAFPHAYVGENFVMLMGTLCRVLEVKKSQVGAFVRVQAECRIAVKHVSQAQPYIRGTVVALPDEPLQDRQRVSQQLEQLRSTMQDLQNLTMKFKSQHTAALQRSMLWWERDVLVPAAAPAAPPGSGNDSIIGIQYSGSSDTGSSRADQSAARTSSTSAVHENAELAERAARLSFAALQRVPEASDMEQLKLLRCCVNALETSNTSDRLSLVHDHMQETFKLLAAKCALKSLKLS